MSARHLVLGSGPDLADWWREREGSVGRFRVCPINNAWSVVGADKTDTWFRSMDFFVKGTAIPKGIDRATLNAKTVTKALHSPFNYNVERTTGTMIFGVLGHLFNTLITKGARDVVVAVACADMVYAGAKTHFYGKGEPDPLRFDYLISTWMARTERAFNSAGYLLVNVGPEIEGTRLTIPRASLEDFQ